MYGYRYFLTIFLVFATPALLHAAGKGDTIAQLIDVLATVEASAPALARMEYTIQAGAFGNLDNAVRLESRLREQKLDAYYFRHSSGLYKVRFGNYKTCDAARRDAENFRRLGLIDNFYIVAPEEYSAAKLAQAPVESLRTEIVRTAAGFLGTPYRWGGIDNDDGFDCSGLTMVCYRLNGLNLPRVSRNQFSAGRSVERRELKPGDLVFFATRGGEAVTHVGLFIGGDRFIHAPRTGQDVQVESLLTPYYSGKFVGGRTFL